MIEVPGVGDTSSYLPSDTATNSMSLNINIFSAQSIDCLLGRNDSVWLCFHNGFPLPLQEADIMDIILFQYILVWYYRIQAD